MIFQRVWQVSCEVGGVRKKCRLLIILGFKTTMVKDSGSQVEQNKRMTI